MKFAVWRASLFNHSLVDEHHRNVIAYRVHPLALCALESASVGLQFDFNLADRTGKYLKKSLTYRHVRLLFIEVRSLTLGFRERQFSARFRWRIRENPVESASSAVYAVSEP